MRRNLDNRWRFYPITFTALLWIMEDFFQIYEKDNQFPPNSVHTAMADCQLCREMWQFHIYMTWQKCWYVSVSVILLLASIITADTAMEVCRHVGDMGLLDWETSGSSRILGISWKWFVNRAGRIKNLELSINFLADFSNMTYVLK